MNENITPNRQEEKKSYFGMTVSQWLIIMGLVIGLALCTLFIGLVKLEIKLVEVIGYSLDINALSLSLLVSFVTTAVFLTSLFNLPWLKVKTKPTLKNIFWFIGLYLCGIAAFCVLIQIGVTNIKISNLVMYPVVAIIVLIYMVMVYYLTFLDRMKSPDTKWELIRFALVGAIAAIFDFAVTSFVRFVVFDGKDIAPFLISMAAVTCGFIVGVAINYLCSITMVFKKTGDKDISKKPLGITLFVVLGAVGLLIGMGLEYIFYDLIGWSEPISFILRTLVVLVWNYVSRKLFIFKNK